MKKLVRDRIPELIRKEGKSPVLYTATQEEYPLYLRKKLQEEVDELLSSEQIEEFADVLEVLMAFAKERDYEWEAVELCRLKKQAERGAFVKGHILEY